VGIRGDSGSSKAVQQALLPTARFALRRFDN
jgi:hypothetical protein